MRAPQLVFRRLGLTVRLVATPVPHPILRETSVESLTAHSMARISPRDKESSGVVRPWAEFPLNEDEEEEERLLVRRRVALRRLIRW